MKTSANAHPITQDASQMPAVSRAGDAAEREARAIADTVTRETSPGPARPIAVSAPLPRRTDVTPLPAPRTAELARGIHAAGPGRPVPAGLRDHFEHRLGHDLAGWRRGPAEPL